MLIFFKFMGEIKKKIKVGCAGVCNFLVHVSL